MTLYNFTPLYLYVRSFSTGSRPTGCAAEANDPQSIFSCTYVDRYDGIFYGVGG